MAARAGRSGSAAAGRRLTAPPLPRARPPLRGQPRRHRRRPASRRAPRRCARPAAARHRRSPLAASEKRYGLSMTRRWPPPRSSIVADRAARGQRRRRRAPRRPTGPHPTPGWPSPAQWRARPDRAGRRGTAPTAARRAAILSASSASGPHPSTRPWWRDSVFQMNWKAPAMMIGPSAVVPDLAARTHRLDLVEREVGEVVGEAQRVEHRHVDVLPTPGLAAQQQRGQQADQPVQRRPATSAVETIWSNGARAVHLRLAGDQPGLGVHHRRVRRLDRLRSVLAEPGDRQHHEPRVAGRQVLPVEVEPAQHAGAEVLDDDIGGCGEVGDERRAAGRVEVDRHVALPRRSAGCSSRTGR